MANTIFGFKFGIKASRQKHIDKSVKVKLQADTKRKTVHTMNIPPADDILEFSYPPESSFEDSKFDETSFKS